ncbi:RNA-binding protein [Blastopirellula marina]|uniref:RNA-binding protein n=1 Tax=Blastopirellula marina TaxID=124 RepID=A0A2S8FH51_9BACT|nr:MULTISPECIES: RNA-binding protein [Pirellulaceae]PQO31420.1 RNA-binding protein [Blastopirellula marina]RCS51813.1 RNA-binding protein [Bremerella cremea]
MKKKLYVGNLPYSYTGTDLENLFGEYGPVAYVSVISDRETGRSRGFGFVEMDNDQDATAAIDALNGFDVDGRKLVVNEAREREGRPGGGGGGGGGGHRGGGGGGGRGGDRGGYRGGR